MEKLIITGNLVTIGNLTLTGLILLTVLALAWFLFWTVEGFKEYKEQSIEDKIKYTNLKTKVEQLEFLFNELKETVNDVYEGKMFYVTREDENDYEKYFTGYNHLGEPIFDRGSEIFITTNHISKPEDIALDLTILEAHQIAKNTHAKIYRRTGELIGDYSSDYDINKEQEE